MGGQGVEVEIQAIARKHGQAAGGEPLPQIMHHAVCRVLGPWPQVEHRDEFAERIDGHPEPEHMRPAAQPRAQFVELDVGQVEIVKDAVVERGTVLAGARHPGGDGGVPMAKHAPGGGKREPFRQRGEHHCNPLRCGFEAIERGHPEGRSGGY